MFEKVGETTHSRFLAAAAGPGDALLAPDCARSLSPSKSGNPLSYNAVLEDVNRLSHLLGRFLDSSAENPGRLAAGGANPAQCHPSATGLSECQRGTPWRSKSGDAEGRLLRRSSRASFRAGRRDGGASAADPAPGWTPGSRRKCRKELMASNGFSGMWGAYGPQKVQGDGGGELGQRDSWSSSGTDESGTAQPCAALEPAEHEWLLAVAEGDWERMEALLLLDAGLLNKRDFVSGLAAAHWLAKQGQEQTLIKLVRLAERRGLRLDLNARAGGGGYTPLHLAAMQGHHALVKLLVGAYSADVGARDYAGRKAWQYLDSKAPGQLKQLAGAEEEQQEPQAVPEEKESARPQMAQDHPVQKPKLSRIASIHRLLAPFSWWRRKAEKTLECSTDK
uniref:ankyrin repeat domain-containing protein SOWAHD n=1 Tax=Pristiophorus japonicus TaxID=55135 RepID=UPI00398EA187